MNSFNSSMLGAIISLYFVAALFFYRYSRKTNDVFFRYFALAFSLLATERIVWLVVGALNELQPIIYCIRLTAYLLIIAAVLSKNRRARVP